MFGGKTFGMDDTARKSESFAMRSPGYVEQSMSVDTTMNTTVNTSATTGMQPAEGPVTDRNILDDSEHSIRAHLRNADSPARSARPVPLAQPRPEPPMIRYPGEARADCVKRILESAKDHGLQRLIGLQVPLARGLRVKPVDAGVSVLFLLVKRSQSFRHLREQVSEKTTP